MNIRLRNMTAIYLTYRGRIYLLYRRGSSVISDSWTGTAGGHFEPHELNDPRACVLRELYEETGLTEDDVEGLSMRYIVQRLKNNEVRQNYYFFAELKKPIDGIESSEGEIRSFTLEETLPLEMPLSAKFMMQHYVAEGHATDLLYCGATTENGIDFTTLTEY